jgi:catechol 2,3-dioxygenase-like lactoylglutathione lyase family enzyme
MKDQMIHHVSVGTNDIRRAKAFYDPLMALIGFRILKESDKAVHYGASDIVFSLETPTDGFPATAGNGVHVAFQAPDRELSDGFTKLLSQMAELTKARLVFVRIITPTIMALSFETSMETRSKP